ncbi:MAG: DUF63 family protein [Candidatus Aenigmarchaeota archaeon]|nr:DUF63 family protein [Candidatus Aenigmarchaeota archaeon]
MLDFIQTYFLQPITQNGWFNPFNTIVYGLILVVAVYLVYRLLRKMNIHIDRYFFIAILPFIYWASSTRVLHDSAVTGVLTPELNQFYGSLIFPTPGSYIITFFLALGVLIFSLVISKVTAHFKPEMHLLASKNAPRSPYWAIMAIIGLILCVRVTLLLPISNFLPFYLIIGTTLLLMLLFYGISKSLDYFKVKNPLSSTNQIVLGAHFLDASATYFALSIFGYLEQHVVPRVSAALFGPISMFFLKIVVVIPVLYLIDQYAEQRDFRNFLKIVVIILGLAPGLRDLIRLMAGV